MDGGEEGGLGEIEGVLMDEGSKHFLPLIGLLCEYVCLKGCPKRLCVC